MSAVLTKSTTTTTATIRRVLAQLLGFSVSATAPNPFWQSTGLNISAGNLLEVTATGTTTAWAGGPAIGPNGFGTDPMGPANSLVSSAPQGALVGRIGTASGFFVGSSLSSDVSSSGTVSLGYNDTFIGNNSGSFTADITIKE